MEEGTKIEQGIKQAQRSSPETTIESKKSTELSSQRIITVRQFVEEGIAEKVGLGKCEVFEVVQPPDENAPEEEKLAFQYMLLTHGNGIRINNVEKVSDDYYIVEGMGMKRDHQLILFDRS